MMLAIIAGLVGTVLVANFWSDRFHGTPQTRYRDSLSSMNLSIHDDNLGERLSYVDSSDYWLAIADFDDLDYWDLRQASKKWSGAAVGEGFDRLRRNQFEKQRWYDAAARGCFCRPKGGSRTAY